MPHVELSVSEPHLARPRYQVDSSLDRWAAAVADAAEASLVIDDEAVIVAISASFERLLGLTHPVVDRPLLDGVLQLLDFADGGALDNSEIMKTPPLLALSSGRLARGLVRVRSASGACTLDAIATPLVQDEQVVGSLTFFSTV